MNTASAPAVDGATICPDADSSTARPHAGTADPAAAARVLTAELDTARSRRAPQAVIAPATGAAEDGVVAGRGGGMPPARRPGSSGCGAGAAPGGSAGISRVRIRELGPADGDVVDVVFAALSPHSRYLRFQSPVDELSAATRRSLTALDGRTHVALAAFAQGLPIGIVRIIDLGEGRGELAVEVVDRWQRRGVGTQLLQAARNRAAELGYRELVGEMLVVNAAVHAALRRVFLITRVRRDDSELTITMAVEPTPASSMEILAA